MCPPTPSNIGQWLEVEEATFTMEEDQGGEAANTSPQKHSGCGYSDHCCLHDWSEVDSEADEEGYKADRQDDNITTDRSSFLTDSQETLEVKEDLQEDTRCQMTKGSHPL